LTTLEEFVQEDDASVFKNISDAEGKSSSLHGLTDLVNVQIVNSFTNTSLLHAHIDSLNLLDAENLRPGWDSYFMVGFPHFLPLTDKAH
jgi:dCMP deaminase